MNLHKNTKLFSGLTLMLTLAMLTSVIPVSADDTHDKKETVVETELNTKKKDSTKVEDETKPTEKSEEAETEEDETVAVTEEVSAETDETSTTNDAQPKVNASNTPPSNDPLTAQKGVVYYNGHRETYYSQKVLPGGGLNIPGRHVAADGTVRDIDNYICVASSDLAKGTVVETSLGTGKVYDTGCASGTIDIYTNW